jgi:hypothetical protein
MPRLTKRSVEAIPVGSKRTHAWDDQLAGFGVRVLPNGRRRYVVKYRVGGGRQARQRWYQLGAHGQITCEQARDRAVQILAAVGRGEDPQGSRKTDRSAPTIGDLWVNYQTQHLPRKKASSAVDDIQKARDYILPSLGKLKIADVAKDDIQKLHQSLADRPYQGNRVLALCSKMFSLAELLGFRKDNSNPCKHIERFQERPRQTFLNPIQIERLRDAVNAAENQGLITPHAAAAVWLLLLTGRAGSVCLNSFARRISGALPSYICSGSPLVCRDAGRA